MKLTRYGLFLLSFFVLGLTLLPHFFPTLAQTCSNDVEPINITVPNLTLTIDAYRNSFSELTRISAMCDALLGTAEYHFDIDKAKDLGGGKVQVNAADAYRTGSSDISCLNPNGLFQSLWKPQVTLVAFGADNRKICEKTITLTDEYTGTPCRIGLKPSIPRGAESYDVKLYDLPTGPSVTDLKLWWNIDSPQDLGWEVAEQLDTNSSSQTVPMQPTDYGRTMNLAVTGVINDVKFDAAGDNPLCQVNFIVGKSGLPVEGASGPGFIDICKFAGAENSGTCYECFNRPGVYTAFGCIETDPQKFIEKILKIAMGIAGGIAFLMIVYGGFTIMTSSGNPERLTQGKEIVTSAIAGLLLIVFSVILLKIIGVDILQIPGL